MSSLCVLYLCMNTGLEELECELVPAAGGLTLLAATGRRGSSPLLLLDLGIAVSSVLSLQVCSLQFVVIFFFPCCDSL